MILASSERDAVLNAVEIYQMERTENGKERINVAVSFFDERKKRWFRRRTLQDIFPCACGELDFIDAAKEDICEINKVARSAAGEKAIFLISFTGRH